MFLLYWKEQAWTFLKTSPFIFNWRGKVKWVYLEQHLKSPNWMFHTHFQFIFSLIIWNYKYEIALFREPGSVVIHLFDNSYFIYSILWPCWLWIRGLERSKNSVECFLWSVFELVQRVVKSPDLIHQALTGVLKCVKAQHRCHYLLWFPPDTQPIM